jgi:hypothetical protein
MSLEDTLKGYKKPAASEIKLPSGEVISINVSKPKKVTSPENQISVMRKFPTIDLPPIEDDEETR